MFKLLFDMIVIFFFYLYESCNCLYIELFITFNKKKIENIYYISYGMFTREKKNE